ncbi:c-type cytochrome [Aeromicrobium tamlense]|uniref:Cytochrome bc1 complex cytochrome c subunit n=1 Tax=Aeromicrobium tamlense TaxID=375541 RepID=A0A8I0KMY6_9ACTN|nr:MULTISPECIES: cytochrome c [Aeromicrobium]MBD1271673.1 c-type cytochrome [Aeromicrobium tamlense]NYI37580.1 ubiquinol-cytochrome c reductase cytochrome c subunit [Aeromicrobium tamlense]
MRKLSTRRRHPMALLALLALALLLTGAAYATVAPEPATAESASSVSQIEAGRQLFVVGCASCHGLNAEGITTAGDGDEKGNYGPSLIGVGAAAVGFQMETGRMPMAQTAPQAPRKHIEYTQDEIDQIAAYVASLAPGPARPSEEDLDWQSVDKEGISEGGEFFRTNCTACHNSVGAGGALPSGRYAPTLKGVDAIHIYEAMLTGPQQMPVFSEDVLTPEDKRNIIAYVKTVQQQGNDGGIGGGGLGPVVDGMFVWIIGIGGLTAFAVWIGMHGTRSKKR